MHRRLALVAGLAFLLGAVAFTFAPSNASDAPCGRWFNPAWDREETMKVVDENMAAVEESQDDSLYSSEISRLEGELSAGALDLAENYRACTDELTRRRNISFGLLAGTVVVPIAILFVAGRETQSTGN